MRNGATRRCIKCINARSVLRWLQRSFFPTNCFTNVTNLSLTMSIPLVPTVAFRLVGLHLKVLISRLVPTLYASLPGLYWLHIWKFRLSVFNARISSILLIFFSRSLRFASKDFARAFKMCCSPTKLNRTLRYL